MLTDVPLTQNAFRHEAFLYTGESEFVDGTVAFIRDGLARNERVFVVVTARKIALLRSVLGNDVADVRFADMVEVGRNPARISPVWHEFIEDPATRAQGARGISEPIQADRSPAELVECQRYESLLNVAFGGTPAWWLLCAYDTTTLDPAVIEEAVRSHPYCLDGGAHHESPTFTLEHMPANHLDDPLPAPGGSFEELKFGPGRLRLVQAMVANLAKRSGMNSKRTDDLVVAANEIATNSLRHGGGEGTLRLWRDDKALVCEIGDKGHIDDPLAGHRAPENEGDDRRGLWLANQLCDLVQIRVFPTGSVVRLHMALLGQAEVRLTYLAMHDQLTGLANRAMLRDRLEHALAVGSRSHVPHAVLFFDLDEFKTVNDTHGHAIGDEVLIEVGHRLSQGVRPGDTVARLGGDEFVVLCEGVGTEDDARSFTERLRRALDEPVPTSAGELSISWSVGLAMSEPGQTAEDLLAQADSEMYVAKNASGPASPLA